LVGQVVFFQLAIQVNFTWQDLGCAAVLDAVFAVRVSLCLNVFERGNTNHDGDDRDLFPVDVALAWRVGLDVHGRSIV